MEQVAKFHERLIEAMEKRDMKAYELSNKTGISQSTISQYRSGYAEPKRNKLKLLSDALHVNPAWLLGLDVSMDPEPEAYGLCGNAQYDFVINNKNSLEIGMICVELKPENQKYLLETARMLKSMESKQQVPPQKDK